MLARGAGRAAFTAPSYQRRACCAVGAAPSSRPRRGLRAACAGMAPRAAPGAPPLQRRVAVIGAGAAGLAAARELLREGHAPVVFEQGPEPGGTWVYSDAADADPLGRHAPSSAAAAAGHSHSSMYAGLRTNLPRELMSFTEFPFTPAAMAAAGVNSRDARRFPSHEEVLAYLRAYAAHYGLRHVIRFGARVLRAAPLWEDGTAAAQAAGSAASGCGAAAAAAGSSTGAGPAGASGDAAAPVTALSGPRWEVTVELEGGSGGRGRGKVQQEVRGAGGLGGRGRRPRRPPSPGPGAPPGCCADPRASRPLPAPGQVFDALFVCNGHYAATNLPDVAGSDAFPGLQMHSHNYRWGPRARRPGAKARRLQAQPGRERGVSHGRVVWEGDVDVCRLPLPTH
jgi:hypothetical protein